jgi:hypothetical protein
MALPQLPSRDQVERVTIWPEHSPIELADCVGQLGWLARCLCCRLCCGQFGNQLLDVSELSRLVVTEVRQVGPECALQEPKLAVGQFDSRHGLTVRLIPGRRGIMAAKRVPTELCVLGGRFPPGEPGSSRRKAAACVPA